MYTTHARPGENDLNCPMNVETPPASDATAADEAHLKALVKFTALSFKTPRPVPFGALIVDSQSGATLLRARNAVALESDPSAHAELRTVRARGWALADEELAVGIRSVAVPVRDGTGAVRDRKSVV